MLYTVTAPALLTDCLQVSCDEFPFNSALEGGPGNARVMAVPTREQQYQGSLQSSMDHHTPPTRCDRRQDSLEGRL